MTALIITGSVALFFAVLLFSSVRLYLSFCEKDMRVSVRYLFIKITLLPAKPRKPGKKEKPAKEEKKEEAKEEEPKKEKDAAKGAKDLWQTVKKCKKAVNTLTRHLVFYKISIVIITGGDEAKDIATGFAKTCILVENLMSLLNSMFVLKPPRKLAISPDFTRDKTFADISLRVKIRPFFVLAALAQAFSIIYAAIRKNKHKHKKVKGGK